MIEARASGIATTNDYKDFFKRGDIDIIIELAGDTEVFYDILSKKSKDVRAMNHWTAGLFFELIGTARKQRETKLELQKTRTVYDVLVNDLIQEDVMVIGLDHRILDMNETMLKKLGLSRDEVVGKHCYEISHHQNIPCEGKEHPCPLVEALSTKKPSQATHVHRGKHDRELFYSISCYPVFDEDDVVGAVEISKDITKDINVQRALLQQQKLASVGQLAAGVAHEINNPLTTILTTAMLIQEDTDPDDPNYEELQTISNEALRCRKIVASLLDFARQTKPMKKSHQINDIVRECIMLTRKQAAFKDVSFEDRLAEEIPPMNLDRDQIQQSVINLALNAIEATAPGGKVTFTTRFVAGENTVEIAVSDTGQGIPEEDLNKIFDPFFTSKAEGTGLGLAITHGFIQQHGGTITVDSRPGQGATFTVRLPIYSNEGTTNVH
jgi:PAS domain S-box-containing protein